VTTLSPEAARGLIPPALTDMMLDSLYAVGGSVRDTVMGRVPNDIDLCTPLLPDDVIRRAKAAGYRVIPTGIKHGTVTVMLDGEPHEITTFRNDVETDGRRATVEFTPILRDDLARRDFTINAMAMDIYGRIHDPFDGIGDIRRCVVRCVGDPIRRFQEDLLRIIRAARFSSTLGFSIDPVTHDGMVQMAPGLRSEIGGLVSIERVRDECTKAFEKSERPSWFLRIMWELGVVQTIIPEMANADDLIQDPRWHPEGSVWNHILEVVDRADPGLRWHALFHDVGKCLVPDPQPEGHNSFHGHDEAGMEVIATIGDRLNLSNDMIESIRVTTGMHMMPMMGASTGPPTQRMIRRFQHRAGQHLPTVEAIIRADTGPRYRPEWDSLFEAREQQNDVNQILRGQDLIDRGYKPGPEMGLILRRAFEHQLDTGETDIDVLVAAGTAAPHMTTVDGARKAE